MEVEALQPRPRLRLESASPLSNPLDPWSDEIVAIQKVIISQFEPFLRALSPAGAQEIPKVRRPPNRPLAFGLEVNLDRSAKETFQDLYTRHGVDRLAELVDEVGVIVIRNDPLGKDLQKFPRFLPLPPNTNHQKLFWHTDMGAGGKILLLHQPEQPVMRKAHTGIAPVDKVYEALILNIEKIKRIALTELQFQNLQASANEKRILVLQDVIYKVLTMYLTGKIDYLLITAVASILENSKIDEELLSAIKKHLLSYSLDGLVHGYFHTWDEPNTTLLISHRFLHCREADQTGQEGGSLLRAYL